MPSHDHTEKRSEEEELELPVKGGRRQLIAISSSTSTTDENGALKQDTHWILPGVGTFRNKATYNFHGDSLPTGLVASDYFVQDRNPETADQIPYNHKFRASNVRVANGFLNLIVPGGQHPVSPTKENDKGVPISCAEIITEEGNIRYASVRTKAIFSKEPGTCHGLFYYKHDTQEADIEYLTDPASTGNDGRGYTIPLWYSNQANATGRKPTQLSRTPPGHPPVDPTTSVHEHRIDWTTDYTEYFFDGHSRAKFTADVPQQPGHWIWNNWANGDSAWSAGPPAKDNVLRIQSMVMYYNTSDSSTAVSQGSKDGKLDITEKAAVGSLLCLC